MFHTNRPKLRIEFTPFDLIIECLSIGLLIYIWMHLFLAYSDLPSQVPSHFNGAGKPDAFSKKAFLFFLPVLTTGMYALLLVLSKYPHLHNYMVNITEDNARQQYRFSVTVLRVINFLCVLMFAYINYHILVGAASNESSLGTGFLFTVLGGSILLPVVIIIYQNKIK